MVSSSVLKRAVCSDAPIRCSMVRTSNSGTPGTIGAIAARNGLMTVDGSPLVRTVTYSVRWIHSQAPAGICAAGR